jgi:cell division septation protein DedD
MKLAFFIACFLSLNGFFAQVTMTANIPTELAPGSNRTVEVKINKGAISNFSKYQIDVPANVTLSEVDSKTGNFSFENNRAKIVWVSIPTESEFIVSFKMEITAAATGTGSFVQKFYFLDNGTKKEIEGEGYTITFNANASTTAPVATTTEPVKTNTPESTPPPTAPITEVKPEVKSVPEPVVAAEPTTKPVVTETKPVSEPPAVKEKPEPVAKVKAEPKAAPSAPAASGQVFKVQIGAYNAMPPKSKYAAAGKASVSNEDGFYKVLVGSFSSKEEAMKKRDDLKAKGLNGFVVSYMNGVRVK